MTPNAGSAVTRHLTPDEFVDVLDGRSAEQSDAHLAACEACQRQLADVRDALEATVSVEAPEPSPLFWDHLSARVRAAVADEHAPRPPWWAVDRVWRPAMLATVGAAAAVMLAVSVGGPRPGDDARLSTNAAQATPSATQPSMMPSTPSTPAAASTASLDDDEPLALMVDLASEVDWENAEEPTLAARGGADRLIVDMSDDERAELQRMLKEALDSGA